MMSGSAFETFSATKNGVCFSHTVVPRMKREEEQIKLTVNLGETPVSILYYNPKGRRRLEREKKKKIYICMYQHAEYVKITFEAVRMIGSSYTTARLY
jgi:hypothetical protein